MPPEENLQPTTNDTQQGNNGDGTQSPLKQIRTFQGDVAEALGTQQESLVSIQRREQVKQDPHNSPAAIAAGKKHKQLALLTLGSIVLFALAAGGAWFAYGEFIRKTAAPIIAGPANRFFSATETQELTLATSTRSSLIATLNALTTEKLGNSTHVVLKREGSDELVATDSFMKTLEVHAPGALLRAFDPLFMYGQIGTEGGMTPPSTFLIIKLVSFENAYAGMLTWEGSLAEDLGPIMGSRSHFPLIAPGTAFQDVTDRNKDMRVLSLEGTPALLYSFFDNKFLIITDRFETMRTLIERLTREKLSR